MAGLGRVLCCVSLQILPILYAHVCVSADADAIAWAPLCTSACVGAVYARAGSWSLSLAGHLFAVLCVMSAGRLLHVGQPFASLQSADECCIWRIISPLHHRLWGSQPSPAASTRSAALVHRSPQPLAACTIQIHSMALRHRARQKG